MADRIQLIEVLNILGNLVRNIQLKRVLSALDPDPPLNFWRLLHGNLLDSAVLDWCKLFGSDDEEHQKTHWKNVVADRELFRTELFRALGIDETAWKVYWKEMKNYRDQYVAHRDFSKSDVTNFPTLDIALGSSYMYYGYVIAELRKLGESGYPNNLREYGEKFAAQSKEIGEKALAATKGVEERVW